MVPTQNYPTLDSPTNAPFDKPLPDVWLPLPSIPPPHPQERRNKESFSRPPQTLDDLVDLQNQYKVTALDAKKSGNKEVAIQSLKVYKQLVALAEALRNGQEIDFSSLPPPPTIYLQG